MELTQDIVKKIEQLIANFKSDEPSKKKSDLLPIPKESLNLDYNYVASMTHKENLDLEKEIERLKLKHPGRNISKCSLTRYIVLHYLVNRDKIDLSYLFEAEEMRRKTTHYNWRKKRA